jgi:hypothetical protein
VTERVRELGVQPALVPVHPSSVVCPMASRLEEVEHHCSELMSLTDRFPFGSFHHRLCSIEELRLHTLPERVANIGDRVDTLSLAASPLQEARSTQGQDVESLRALVRGVSDSVTTVCSRVTKVESSVAAGLPPTAPLVSELTTLGGRQDQLAVRLGEMEARMTQVASTVPAAAAFQDVRGGVVDPSAVYRFGHGGVTGGFMGGFQPPDHYQHVHGSVAGGSQPSTCSIGPPPFSPSGALWSTGSVTCRCVCIVSMPVGARRVPGSF